MRTWYLAAIAAGAGLTATATLLPGGERAQPDLRVSAFDPLALAQSMCRPREMSRFGSRRGFFLSAATAYAQTIEADRPEGAPPLMSGLGAERIDITTSNAEARAYFDQGLLMLHAFNHAEAMRSFETAQELDPECAMCFWGSAFALGPNINAPMDPANAEAAYAAAQAALARAEGATEFERALIEAQTVRYAEDAPSDRAHLEAAYADAMAAVADRFPESDEAQALAAEAGMNTQPWDYWEVDGRTPRGRTADIISRIETVLARNPNHAPAIHLYIHMTEASYDPWRAEASADELVGLAPSAGHLVHMPAHTYLRIGRFEDSLEANIRAVNADEAYLEGAGDMAGLIYRYGYYPHNIHFALVSAQMGGDEEAALDMADRLDAALPMEMASVAPWVQPIKAAPWYARAQFAEPDELIAQAPPADMTPFVEIAYRYALGEAHVRAGDTDAARIEAAEISRIAAEADWTALSEAGVPAADIARISELVVLGRAAMADANSAAAVERFAAAADIQDAMAYMEPPWWYYPVRQSYAAALLADGQAALAEHEFMRTLLDSPNNGWAYWGLAQARGERGDRTGRSAALQQWRRAWLGTRRGMSLDRI